MVNRFGIDISNGKQMVFENIIKVKEDINSYNEYAQKVCSEFCLRCPSRSKSKYNLGFHPVFCDVIYHSLARHRGAVDEFCCDYNAERLCNLKNG